MMRLEPRQPWQLRLQIRGWFEDMNINITFWYVVEIIIWGYQLFIFDICNIHLLTNWQRPQAQQVVIHAVYSFLLKTKKDIRWYQNNYLRKKRDNLNHLLRLKVVKHPAIFYLWWEKSAKSFCALLAKAVKILYFTCWKTTNSDRLFVSSAECQGDNVKLCQISAKRRRVCLNSR